VEAEVQMKEAWMPVSQIPVGCGDVAEIGTPVGAWKRQLDRGQRPVGDPPQQFILRTK
jgi:hypothetical protein